MALCEIKAGNVEQRMERKQIDKNDTWAWYQARNIRQEVLDTSARQLRTLAAGQSDAVRATMSAEAAKHESLAQTQRKMVDVEKQARALEAEYEALDRHHDQLDLEAASLSIAISLLAMTALTRKRWLYVVAGAHRAGPRHGPGWAARLGAQSRLPHGVPGLTGPSSSN